MLLDLHIEGSAPVTLLVRDESRSTRSTSGGNLDDENRFAENFDNGDDKLGDTISLSKKRKHIQQHQTSRAATEEYEIFSASHARQKCHKRKHSKTGSKTQTNMAWKDQQNTNNGKLAIGHSQSLSSSKSSLSLDSFHSESEIDRLRSAASSKGSLSSRQQHVESKLSSCSGRIAGESEKGGIMLSLEEGRLSIGRSPQNIDKGMFSAAQGQCIVRNIILHINTQWTYNAPK